MEEQSDPKRYPVTSSGYELLEEIGQGVSATVYRALCIPFKEVVAVKCLDLEKCVSNLDGIRREAQMMSLISHPNVVKAYCSFVVEQTLWVVMPYMAGGSCLHIMKSAYPDGFDEPVIATVLKASLKALEYLHRHGHIHRDVKAGNILMDANGAVKLGDFGVSACMFDTGDRQRSRNTFVGTPCWMAPEVVAVAEQLHGYDFKADIWSFGITGLELAHGHAPFSKYPPMKVLLMTLQNAPPGLDYERDKRFSKLFKEMIAMCLVKDPAKRPTAEKLLKHGFFKNARNCEYVVHHVLDGLPSLGDRVKTLKMKDAVKLAQNKMPSGGWEELSQNEYKRGVSRWNFNVEDLTAQAATIEDDYRVTVKEAVKVAKVHDGNGAPPRSRERKEGSDDIKAADLNDKIDSLKNRDRKDDQDGAAPVPTKSAFPTVVEDRPVVENKVVPAVSTTSKGGDALADGGGETRSFFLSRSESMLSPHPKKAGETIVRTTSSGRWDQKHVGRFNIFGSARDLGIAGDLISANSHDHDLGEGKLGRREDGAAACRHVTSAADRDSADDKLHSGGGGSDGREARHVPVRPKEDLPWTKPQFWERGSASARCSSSGSKEGLGIVQKKGRFSITSEDVETPSEKEREQQVQINVLQSKITNLMEELQTVKSRNVELERQLSLDAGLAAKDLTTPNK